MDALGILIQMTGSTNSGFPVAGQAKKEVGVIMVLHQEKTKGKKYLI